MHNLKYFSIKILQTFYSTKFPRSSRDILAVYHVLKVIHTFVGYFFLHRHSPDERDFSLSIRARKQGLVSNFAEIKRKSRKK